MEKVGNMMKDQFLLYMSDADVVFYEVEKSYGK